jgi:large subunit ribosomal protein L9
MMQVFMLKDVEKIGMAGQVVKVADGYASNYLFPNKLAVRVDASNKDFYENRQVREKITQEVLSTKVAMLAERIKALHITVKQKVHDDGKLYGSLSADVIVDLLKAKEIAINKKQVEFGKSIKATGEHKVTIRLSSKLKPELTLKVVGDAKAA